MNASLSQDQGYLLARLTKLSKREERYLHLLIEIDRCGISERKNELLNEIKGIQTEELKSEKFLNKKLLNDTLLAYHAHPDLQIVHIAILTGDKTFTSLNKVRDQLGLSEERLISILNQLVDLQIIEEKEGVYINCAKDMHISSDHPLTQVNQVMLRSKSLAKVKSQSREDNYLFSATISGDGETFVKIKSKYMHFLKKLELLVREARAINTYQINFDLFPWARGDW